MVTVTATQANFEQLVSGDKTLVVDFWAPWCGPCRSFAPVYEQASENHPDVVFASAAVPDAALPPPSLESKVNTEVDPAPPCARDIHASCISAQQALAGCSDVHGRTSVA
jgi:thiol-disulfide isomerase/thioredoxin